MRWGTSPAVLAVAGIATLLAVGPARAAQAVADPKPNAYDHTAPTLTLNPPTFPINTQIDEAPAAPSNGCDRWHFNIPLQIGWTATDAISGVAHTDLYSSDDRSPLSLSNTTEPARGSEIVAGGNYGSDCGDQSSNNYYAIGTVDNRGNSAMTHKMDAWVDVWQETGEAAEPSANPLPVARTGSWSTANCTCFDYGQDLYSTAKGASLTYTVNVDKVGRVAALVMAQGPARGAASVSIDGGAPTTVNTNRSQGNLNRAITWQSPAPLSVGQHTIKIINAGTAATPRIDVDALLLSDPDRFPLDATPSVYDHTAPTATLNAPVFTIGGVIGATVAPTNTNCGDGYHYGDIPMSFSWTAKDSNGLAGVDLYEFDGQSDPAIDSSVPASGTHVLWGTNYDSDCGGPGIKDWWLINARDNQANSAATTWVSNWVDVYQENGAQSPQSPPIPMAATGSWSTSSCACFDYGKDSYSTTAGASLTYTVTTTKPGQVVALVMPKAANRGVANISVDGATATKVDTKSASSINRVIVWQKTLSVGTHKIKVTNAATAGRPRIDVDAVLLSDPADPAINWTPPMP
jgi:hypothetical protein